MVLNYRTNGILSSCRHSAGQEPAKGIPSNLHNGIQKRFLFSFFPAHALFHVSRNALFIAGVLRHDCNIRKGVRNGCHCFLAGLDSALFQHGFEEAGSSILRQIIDGHSLKEGFIQAIHKAKLESLFIGCAICDCLNHALGCGIATKQGRAKTAGKLLRYADCPKTFCEKCSSCGVSNAHTEIVDIGKRLAI